MESDSPMVNGDGPLDSPIVPDLNSMLDTLSVLPMLIGLS